MLIDIIICSIECCLDLKTSSVVISGFSGKFQKCFCLITGECSPGNLTRIARQGKNVGELCHTTVWLVASRSNEPRIGSDKFECYDFFGEFWKLLYLTRICFYFFMAINKKKIY